MRSFLQYCTKEYAGCMTHTVRPKSELRPLILFVGDVNHIWQDTIQDLSNESPNHCRGILGPVIVVK